MSILLSERIEQRRGAEGRPVYGNQARGRNDAEEGRLRGRRKLFEDGTRKIRRNRRKRQS